MSIKRLLPLAGLVALIGCAGTSTGPCLRDEPTVIGLDSLGAEVTVVARVPSEQCSELENDF